MTWSLRLLFVGGLLSYRGLWAWLSPWIYIPSLLVAPFFQIALFVYVGRGAGIESDAYFVVGNALQYTAIPCLFAMASMIAGDRGEKTLAIALSSPAPAPLLFLGRFLPVAANGWLVAGVSLTVASWVFDLRIPLVAWPSLALVILIASVSCTGLGMVQGAIGLRLRSTVALSNIIFGLLLILTCANVPAYALPAPLRVVSDFLPLTHAIRAAQALAAGGSLRDSATEVGAELLIGCCYTTVGLVALRYLELSSRRSGSLDLE